VGVNVADFQADLERFEDAMIEEIVEAKKLLAEEAIERLAEKSPVLTGTYIYNHKVTSGKSVDPSIIWLPHTPGEKFPSARAAKKGVLGPEMIMRERLKLQGMAKFAADDITVGNPVPYADDIEHGSSNFAPAAPYGTTLGHLETAGDVILTRIREKVI